MGTHRDAKGPDKTEARRVVSLGDDKISEPPELSFFLSCSCCTTTPVSSVTRLYGQIAG
jgi:hypothetical protein